MPRGQYDRSKLKKDAEQQPAKAKKRRARKSSPSKRKVEPTTITLQSLKNIAEQSPAMTVVQLVEIIDGVVGSIV